MSQFASKTEVPVEKTRAEIETTVKRYGADSFLSGWEGPKAMIQFRCKDRFVRFDMMLPDREDERFTEYRQGRTRFRRKPSASEKLWEQACRQKWRALLLMIKAKLEGVESGIVTFEQEFLAHIVLPDGKTIYDRVREPIALAYDKGDGSLFLPGPST